MKETAIVTVTAPDGTTGITEAIACALNDPANYPDDADTSDWSVNVADGEPTILTTNFELLRLLDGHDLTFATTDGVQIKMRLYSTGELLAAQAEASDGDPELAMTREQAAELCRPIGLRTLAQRLGGGS